MGFIVNQNTGPFGDRFPYMVEQERNHAAFVAAAVAVGDATNVITGADQNFANAWFLPGRPPSPPPGGTMAAVASRASGQAVGFASSRHQGRRGD